MDVQISPPREIELEQLEVLQAELTVRPHLVEFLQDQVVWYELQYDSPEELVLPVGLSRDEPVDELEAQHDYQLILTVHHNRNQSFAILEASQ